MKRHLTEHETNAGDGSYIQENVGITRAMRTNTVQGQMGLSVILDQIEQRANAATPGPWNTENWDAVTFAWFMRAESKTDKEFIASARTDVPKLIKALRKALELVNLYPDGMLQAITIQDVTAILNGEDAEEQNLGEH